MTDKMRDDGGAAYWRGYEQAVIHCDAIARKTGDDDVIRNIRREMMALIKREPIPFATRHREGGQ